MKTIISEPGKPNVTVTSTSFYNTKILNVTADVSDVSYDSNGIGVVVAETDSQKIVVKRPPLYDPSISSPSVRQHTTISSSASVFNIGDPLPDLEVGEVYVSSISVNIINPLSVSEAPTSPLYAQISDGTNILANHAHLDVKSEGTHMIFLPMTVISTNSQISLNVYSNESCTTTQNVDSGEFTAVVHYIKA